jgi:K+-sensing histidine kinase KdpD
MKKLFVKYAKLSNLPTGGEKSSGLGLAIRKKVSEIQGGRTGARNYPGGGATFCFELPGGAVEGQSIDDAADAEGRPNATGGSLVESAEQ